ncbi:MAG: hypothetical protein IT326_07835 [Anaerolineae bacterium]|nr:hypothetical protein [Anaerolineae bacterium]
MSDLPPTGQPGSARDIAALLTLERLRRRISGLFDSGRLSNAQIILLLMVALGGLMIANFSQRIVQGQRKVAEQRQLEAEILALQAEQRALQAAKSYYSAPGYVEIWAHSDGKMVMGGETLIVPVYPSAEPQDSVATDEAPQPGTRTSPHTLPPWQVWWSLFFDTPPPTR